MKNKELLKTIQDDPYIPLYMKKCEFQKLKDDLKWIKSKKMQSEKHLLMPVFKPKIIEL